MANVPDDAPEPMPTAGESAPENGSAAAMPATVRMMRNANPVAPVMEKFQLGKGSRYFFGRLYILLSWLLALGVLIVGVVFSWRAIADTRSKLNELPDKYRQSEINKKLNRCGSDLVGEFNNVVTLLGGSGQVNRSGEFDGFRLQEADRKLPPPFNLACESLRDVQESRQMLNQYKKQLEGIRSSFRGYFEQLLNALQRGGSGRAARSGNTGRSEAAAPARIVLSTGAVRLRFYASESEQKNNARILLELLEQLRKARLGSGNTVSRECSSAEAVTDFILRRLFSRQDNTTLVRGTNRTASNANVERDETERETTVSQEELYRMRVELLVNELSENWRIDGVMAQMETLLDEMNHALRQITAERRALNRQLSDALLKLWLKILAVAFGILVTADYLRAHFDTADTLREIKNNPRSGGLA